MGFINKKYIMFIIFILFIPITYSDGGCIKVADDVLVQLSSAPLVPIVGKQVSYLFSFGNKEGLINKEINGKLKIVKNDETILTKNFKIKDGILSLKHTYKSPGLYEIFLDFDIGNKNYTPEDFLIEVNEQKQPFVFYIIFLFIGFILGMIIMKLIKKWEKNFF